MCFPAKWAFAGKRGYPKRGGRRKQFAVGSIILPRRPIEGGIIRCANPSSLI